MVRARWSLRKLFTRRVDNLIWQKADAERDARNWEAAIDLYRKIVTIQPERSGLLIQVGHCLKEMGRCEEALGEYLSVLDISDKPEAYFQAGQLLKMTGNFAAARQLFGQSAASGHALAVADFNRLAANDVVSSRMMFASAVETGVDEYRILTSLFSLEIAPLDWRNLAGAAEEAAVRGLTEHANLLADLALIVGGAVSQRQGLYKTIFESNGAWVERYSGCLRSAAFGRVGPVTGLRRMVDAFDFTASPTETTKELAEPGTPTIRVINGNDAEMGLHQTAEAVAAVREVVFAKTDLAADALVAAIRALVGAQPERGQTIYVSMPAEGRYSLAAVFTRVCLNTTAAIASRLAAPLREPIWTPSAIAAGFAVPTARATLSTCAAGDPVPAIAEIEHNSRDAALQERLSELITLGLIPGGEAGMPERLIAMAEQGRHAALEYWFAANLKACLPELLAEVAIRAANAMKKSGEHAEALRWTERAAAAMPERFSMDLGIQRKINGDFAGAASAFISVLTRDPKHEAAARELNAVVRECMEPTVIAALADEHPGFGERYRAMEESARVQLASVLAKNARDIPSMVLGIDDLRDNLDFGSERLEYHQIGWLRTETGGYPRLVGVVSIRMCHVTRDPPLRMRLRIDGRTIDIAEPSPSGIDENGKGRYFFNSWIDTGALLRGPAQLEAYVELKSGGYTTLQQTVVIDDLSPGESYERSDAFVPALGEAGPGAGLVARVLALPANARDAARTPLDRPVERILIMRLDQLGDLSASMPGIRSLRELFPQAYFEGMVTPANAYILRASGLFDEVFTVDFTYDHGTRRRWLGRSSYAALRQRYGKALFDIAIDLSPGEDSRPVLKLIQARYRAGFKPHRFPFLDFGFDIVSRDALNGRESVSHTAMISGFVDALAAMLRPPPERFPVDSALARHLEPIGLTANTYIAIHVGARLAIKRWPLGHYIELAEILRTRIGLDILMFSDDPVPEAQMTQIKAIGGIQVMAGRVEFEVFDALISNAAVFIGNDTGPKHMAAMRGVRTVSVHMGQVNWNEWGQDGEGLVVSKRVPCCGCGIEDPSECGKSMACLDGLRPEEVAKAVELVLGSYTKGLDF